ncbi:MAG: tRNA-dihydrouridine synthase [candidate division Zixibacteria bacterium]|nr:tRNA-dihydrouridine synthase [candidate division Zixibacteria bacterium]
METESRVYGFWKQLKAPIFAMAPMADVTDAAFREIIARRGKPDVFFTEFVAVDGLCSAGRPNLLKSLMYHESERPIVAQFFGEKPKHFYETAQLAVELGFDGIDLNMGCPVRTVTKTGSGAALIKTPGLAKEIIVATQEGAGNLPVSIKTRIGFSKIALEDWVGHLLETKPAAITLHLRTAKEMSLVDAHWELISQAVRAVQGTGTILLGNGDVKSIAEAEELVKTTGIDGVMLGRAIYGNPWLFNRSINPEDITVEEKFSAMIEHAHLFESIFQGHKNFAMMRKHLRSYASGFAGSKELRVSFEQVNSALEVRDCIDLARHRMEQTLSVQSVVSA